MEGMLLRRAESYKTRHSKWYDKKKEDILCEIIRNKKTSHSRIFNLEELGISEI